MQNGYYRNNTYIHLAHDNTLCLSNEENRRKRGYGDYD